MYKKIILEANIHRVGFNPNNRIKGTLAYKYTLHNNTFTIIMSVDKFRNLSVDKERSENLKRRVTSTE